MLWYKHKFSFSWSFERPQINRENVELEVNDFHQQTLVWVICNDSLLSGVLEMILYVRNAD